MQCAIVVLLALVAAAAAVGQFYVPRAYYTIDAEGHPSPPVALRRLRRSYSPYPSFNPYPGSGDATANANANAWGGGSATANANANAGASPDGQGPWGRPSARQYIAPMPLSAGQTRYQYGPVVGRSVSASTSVDVDYTGRGYYDQSASVY